MEPIYIILIAVIPAILAFTGGFLLRRGEIVRLMKFHEAETARYAKENERLQDYLFYKHALPSETREKEREARKAATLLNPPTPAVPDFFQARQEAFKKQEKL